LEQKLCKALDQLIKALTPWSNWTNYLFSFSPLSWAFS
jgi:hypothetical protein